MRYPHTGGMGLPPSGCSMPNPHFRRYLLIPDTHPATSHLQPQCQVFHVFGAILFMRPKPRKLLTILRSCLTILPAEGPPNAQTTDPFAFTPRGRGGLGLRRQARSDHRCEIRTDSAGTPGIHPCVSRPERKCRTDSESPASIRHEE